MKTKNVIKKQEIRGSFSMPGKEWRKTLWGINFREIKKRLCSKRERERVIDRPTVQVLVLKWWLVKGENFFLSMGPNLLGCVRCCARKQKPSRSGCAHVHTHFDKTPKPKKQKLSR